MEDVITFCDKAIEKITFEISVIESRWNKKLQHEKWQPIYVTLKRSNESNPKFLQQKKSRKFNYLKFKPKQTPNPESLFEKDENTQETNIHT